MFESLPINAGLTPPEIEALNKWNQELLKKAWSHRTWPSRVYHYTTPTAFKAIVETGVLRGTHLAFTNDVQEYRHAAILAQEVAEAFRPNANADQRRLLDAVCANLASTTLFNMFPYGIACFTENPDQLSQWRAYCGEGGIAIGFDTQQLVKNANRQGNIFGPAIYDIATKKALITESFEWMMDEYPKRIRGLAPNEIDTHLEAWVYNWAWRAAYIAPLFKDGGFKEESEWRFMRRFIYPWEVKYLAKRTHLCPYLEIHAGEKRTHPTHWAPDDPRRAAPMPPKLPITELWFGPSRYQEHAHASCKFFLEHYDYTGVQLNVSKTPFRSIA
jgi:hypothetical protein